MTDSFDPVPLPPPGWRWICCRYRRVPHSERILDAHEYGYKAWRFLVRQRK